MAENILDDKEWLDYYKPPFRVGQEPDEDWGTVLDVENSVIAQCDDAHKALLIVEALNKAASVSLPTKRCLTNR